MLRMKQAVLVALAAALARQAIANEGSRKESKQPFEIVRSIEAIQDQIVLGNAIAKSKLPAILDQLAARLLAADSTVWRDAKNVRAGIVYVLSGGQARILRKAIESGTAPAAEMEFMRGALAYVEGNQAEAKKLLLKIGPGELPPLAGGHLALVQSALLAKEDPVRALKLLGQARILAPGTLIEETALRRSVVLAADIGDVETLEAISREYQWRFPKSVYFESFRERLAAAAVGFGLAIEPGKFAKIDQLASVSDSVGQLRIYLQIAQRAIIGGKPRIARLAAERGLALSAEGSASRARSKLYEAAALILTDGLEAGLEQLNAPEMALLGKEDAELKDAVIALAAAIRPALGEAQGPAPPQQAETGEPRPRTTGESASAEALISFARDKLAQTDALLRRN